MIPALQFAVFCLVCFFGGVGARLLYDARQRRKDERDRWRILASIWNVYRRPGESDESLRDRLRAAVRGARA